MTRINVGIKPEILTGKHLIAEHREIKRIPNQVKAGRIKIGGIPDEFTLGTGHVKFFVDKLGYLKDRYTEIHSECLKRGYNVSDFSTAWEGVPSYLMGSYTPSSRDRRIVMERLISKDDYYRHV